MFRFLRRGRHEQSPNSSPNGSPKTSRRPAKSARLPVKALSLPSSIPADEGAGAATIYEIPHKAKTKSRASKALRSRASKSWDVVIVNSDCGGGDDDTYERHSPLPSYQQPPGFDDDVSKPSLVKQVSTDSGIVADDKDAHDSNEIFSLESKNAGSCRCDVEEYVDFDMKTDTHGNTIVPPLYRLEPRPRTDSIDSECSSTSDFTESDVYQETRRHNTPNPPPRRRSSPLTPSAPAPPPRPSRPSLSEGADGSSIDGSSEPKFPVTRHHQSVEQVSTADIITGEWFPKDVKKVIVEHLSRDRAESLLKAQDNGTFLLRSSHEIVVLSAFDGTNVHHLQFQSEGFLMNFNKFNAKLFQDFVRHYSTNKTDLPMRLNTLILLVK